MAGHPTTRLHRRRQASPLVPINVLNGRKRMGTSVNPVTMLDLSIPMTPSACVPGGEKPTPVVTTTLVAVCALARPVRATAASRLPARVRRLHRAGPVQVIPAPTRVHPGVTVMTAAALKEIRTVAAAATSVTVDAS